MAHQVTLGGERLGSGKKEKIALHNYYRSTHDLSHVWRSTMGAGTLVPFLKLVALPGDTFDIDLDCDVLTHPTIGPLFGSYKVQLDVFQVPMRLYQGKLHMNMLGIGMDMSKVALPQVQLAGPAPDYTKPIDNQQVNSSSLFAYLGMRGIGYDKTTPSALAIREFNAIPYLAYWDIYKNYYANKQEEIGAYIIKNLQPQNVVITTASIHKGDPDPYSINTTAPATTYDLVYLLDESYIKIVATGLTVNFDPALLKLTVKDLVTGQPRIITCDKLWTNWQLIGSDTIIGNIKTEQDRVVQIGLIEYDNAGSAGNVATAPEISTFPLSNIDDMRMSILAYAPTDTPFTITSGSPAPYGPPLTNDTSGNKRGQMYNQVGLALKTYQSDLFNNWISTEWIDGPDGIAAITAIDTSGGSFTIDELNLSKKIYDMLNRIAVSGGTYDDWLDAVYTHERQRGAENPMYIGGLSTKLVFQEVVSLTSTEEQPLGTLAGRGRVSSGKKGGRIIAKVDEPSYIMGIISLTPLVDYSQGNDCDVNLRTMNDLHKPALDAIGFQDLTTDQMAWFDTAVNTRIPEFKSAGKQPAWINYMTAVNKTYGNFAVTENQMWMTLNRRYELGTDAGGLPTIKDLTTYIDPTKFNNIFADSSIDAQNFWVQIAMGITARRKMSAKVIPNL